MKALILSIGILLPIICHTQSIKDDFAAYVTPNKDTLFLSTGSIGMLIAHSWDKCPTDEVKPIIIFLPLTEVQAKQNVLHSSKKRRKKL